MSEEKKTTELNGSTRRSLPDLFLRCPLERCVRVQESQCRLQGF